MLDDDEPLLTAADDQSFQEELEKETMQSGHTAKRARLHGDDAGADAGADADVDADAAALKTARFEDAFKGNENCTSWDEMVAHKAEMLEVCQRHFCAITKGTMPKVVELEYFEEAPTKLLTTIIRNPQMTIATYGNRSIYVSLVEDESDEEEKTTEKKWKVNRSSKMPLLKWYLDHQARFEKDRVEIYPTAEEANMNPRDLNIYCALPFDIPFEKAHANPEDERAAFADPSPGEAVDWEAWRRLEGLDLLLWTLKYVICDGDETSFAYLMQWSAFIFQKRRKPCVLVIVHGPPGSVKSAIFGSNQTGAGPYMRGSTVSRRTN